ncbi:MAG: ATP-binding cassette domain-containing protein [Actinomycetales bacterium]|jgi:ABC-type nitrate/sulfonate/bicarbonate transport system ATPase subunit|nr:ATP-binding cassette domain-containing protein [Candidatus Phosphoribacter baldrii]MBK6956379.1 ATP-binding cassette domain-containing protein [Candidatus Phosphoribacter baldrii]
MGTLLAHLDGVTVRRGTREVLRGIDLDLPTGTVLALLGPSGAGKSTLLALLAGQVTPADGEVRWTTPDPRVGLVTQAPHLFPWLTVTENIAIGLRYAANRTAALGGSPDSSRSDDVASDGAGPTSTGPDGAGPTSAGPTSAGPGGGADPTFARLGVGGLLERLDLQGVAGHYPDQLSGGQAQRVSLARTLVVDPDLVLLDEPFSALDPAAREDLQAWYLGHARRHGRTTVVVTHDVDEALVLADRVALLSADGTLARIWDVQPATSAAAARSHPLRDGIRAAFDDDRELVGAAAGTGERRG